MTAHTVAPLTPGFRAVVEVPGSKSLANRALVCAALADGVSRLHNLPSGDDTSAMIAGLTELGIAIEADADRSVTVAGHDLRVGDHGDAITVDCRLAGTTSRFLTALGALVPAPVTIDGDEPLQQRPFGPLHDALTQLGCAVSTERPGGLPATVSGQLSGRHVSVAGDVSSQYLTAIMLIGPYLADGVTITLTTELVSRPYVEMTAAVMAAFGVDGVEVEDREITVPSGRYQPTDYTVEPDASSASYPLAMAAVVPGTVTIGALGRHSLQGDSAFASILSQMGATVTYDDDGVTLTGPDQLVGIDIDMADVSDLVPTLAAVATCAVTPTTIRGVGFIRGKESDRLGDLAAELTTLGADVAETEDGLVIQPSRDRLHGGRVATHHDHRLAMAFGVLSSVVEGTEVADPEVVSKSWPGFWEAYAQLSAAC
ncbi:MAG: 3-phosphoshikimate 1-carboxyvinyltransferase [Ilumatobacter coccineus]|uniref:3-phosphoshikimate 1-carboxyvinyltransferase n=1 Tax=Ilumatobacter coccineus TaxID=467094 RepID=A0A2G6KDD2_9ACTN|nr:MAG: 3-phosphoshikimate 1-carboxyvinyltransferase [Ilumatobacter coccineus]